MGPIVDICFVAMFVSLVVLEHKTHILIILCEFYVDM